MELDLSKLNKLSTVTAKTTSEATEQPQNEKNTFNNIHNPTKEKSPLQGKIEPIDGIPILQREADQKQDELERAKAVYSQHQENTRKSSNLQTEILKGLEAGENVYNLFLKAVEAISLITGNTAIYTQAKEEIKAVYGEGLLEAPALQQEIEQTEQRLTRLKQSAEREISGDSKKRILNAIKAHEAKITELRGLAKT